MVKIDFGKRDFIWIGLIVVLVGVGFVYGYGGSNPAYVGHSAGEIEGSIPSGYCMLSISEGGCPSGWSEPSLDGRFLRIETGTLGNGGSSSMSGMTGPHSLTVAQMPSHAHNVVSGTTRQSNLGGSYPYMSGYYNPRNSDNFKPNIAGVNTVPDRGVSSSAGSSQAHSHSMGLTWDDNSLPLYSKVTLCCKS